MNHNRQWRKLPFEVWSPWRRIVLLIGIEIWIVALIVVFVTAANTAGFLMFWSH